MIEIQNLTKRYGEKVAVDDVSFTVRPGVVTGFLGPNGAGKSTTMRAVMGLDSPTSGSAVVDGRPYRELRDPLRRVGALLEAKAVHKGRSAYDHLRALAATHRIPKARVEEVIGMTGLERVAKQRVGGFSLGMGQRLGIAAALLGDPQTLILDEPVNGLDPEGVVWVRQLARSLAAEGRAVFISSHLMSEMALTADRIVVMGRGRVLADTDLADLVASSTERSVSVRTPEPDRLMTAIAGPDVTVTYEDDGALHVRGLGAEQIGEAAAASGIVLHRLASTEASLEQAYLELTHDEVEYRSEVAR
ncbi:ABC transporter ATP-binding protein [Curtobacterium sp. NPDC087082]|uniref:ABC transporter ATP-binding protein n=1 Tax=unclassified Curtobacterium TaxID=257496 RepID=UPI00089DE72B|nr:MULTISPECIES: ABC transporter ATP-binding protein [unclassified Curtobacterium]AOX66464.1 multidrug ABC transporter ATP-binding protein [Curtobacterium sp. BH-2-1-1]MCT9621332.1 ABC transporter ATP-binding protein [Curtobacterium sp. C2H10]OII23111.1 multidrug ABC transporter ATP-binding protein [Curtobacterium sp. MCBA15_013]